MSRTNTTVTVTVTAPPPVGGPPAITSAVLAGSTITISGGNFGVKTTPAPTFFQPFTGLANGATPTAAGFDSWINRGGEAVTLADGVGGGSLRCDPGAANNAFPHIGRYLPANVLEMRLSFFFKLYGNHSGGIRQMKFVRAGMRMGDPLADYAGGPKFYPSLWLNSGPVTAENSLQASWGGSGQQYSFYTEDSGAGGTGVPVGQQPNLSLNQWVFADVYYKFNDIGQSNGAFFTALNGFVHQNRTIVTLRANTSEYIGFVQPIPSIDIEGNPTEYDYAMTRVYIDTGAQSIARVFLSNSATYAGVTQRFMLPASAWSATGITVSSASSVPAGYRYLYVVSPSGEFNASGYSVGGL
jgi:hypothetical protein